MPEQDPANKFGALFKVFVVLASKKKFEIVWPDNKILAFYMTLTCWTYLLGGPMGRFKEKLYANLVFENSTILITITTPYPVHISQTCTNTRNTSIPPGVLSCQVVFVNKFILMEDFFWVLFWPVRKGLYLMSSRYI